jgi:hypothetical protein
VALGDDLLGAVSEGGVSPPAAWAMRLLLRRVWGPHPCRVGLWRGLYRAGMLHALDLEEETDGGGGDGDGDDGDGGCTSSLLGPYLHPPERAAEMLDLYAEALGGTAALPPVSPGKGGLAWLMAVRHVGAHTWGPMGDEAGLLSEAARRRLGRVLRGVVAAAATLDVGSGEGWVATAVCLLGYRGVPAAVLEAVEESGGERPVSVSVPAAVARLAAWAQGVWVCVCVWGGWGAWVCAYAYVCVCRTRGGGGVFFSLKILSPPRTPTHPRTKQMCTLAGHRWCWGPRSAKRSRVCWRRERIGGVCWSKLARRHLRH